MAAIKVKDGNEWKILTGFTAPEKHAVSLALDGTILKLTLNDGTVLSVDLAGLSPAPTPIEDIQYITSNNETFITSDDKNFIVREEI